MTTLKNRPAAVTLMLAGLVLGHLLVSSQTSTPSLASMLGQNDSAWSLYLGAASTTAVIGGFAGVVVVFAMASNPRFAKMRIASGEGLASFWVSPVASSLGAAGSAVAAAVLALSGRGEAGAWVFEFGLLVSLHAGVRLLWMLWHLVRAVRNQDLEDERERSAVGFDDLVGTRN